ncbi:MAG: hypothetical protein HUJ80_07035, partial [Firmicutes bacterium]|nr:hypothetical protein [Bacillota bacterium]
HATLARTVVAGYYAFGCVGDASFEGGRAPLLLGCSFAAAYGAVVFCCILPVKSKTKSEYLLCRLQVCERAVILLDALSGAMMYALLYGAEIVTVCLLAELYRRQPGYGGGLQGIVVSLYRSEFLHGLIPLKDVSLWQRNGLYIICAGIAGACGTFDQRNKARFSGVVILVVAYIAADFCRAAGEVKYGYPGLIVILSATSLIIAMVSAHHGYRRRPSDDGKA